MLFNDLPLVIAVHKIFNSVSHPSSEEWTGEKSKTMYKLVLQELVEDEAWTERGIPWSKTHSVRAWMQIRKQKKLRLLCRVAVVHGKTCFYANRGLGNCSENVELDRLVPRSRGGRYSVGNCIISCSFHNQSRGDLSIEEFLSRAAIPDEIHA